MVKPITTYVTQKRLSWYGHVLRRDDTNVSKHVTTMTVGGKRPRGRPKLRWIDRVKSDLRHHQLYPKLAQDQEAWRNAVMAIDPGREYFIPKRHIHSSAHSVRYPYSRMRDSSLVYSTLPSNMGILETPHTRFTIICIYMIDDPFS